MRRSPDLFTMDLFKVPAPRQPSPGALAVGPALRGVLSDMLKSSSLNRSEVASRMSELTGQEISKHQLDAWTAESREAWRFPLEFLPAAEVACQSHEITAWLAEIRGCKILVGKEAIDAEIGKLERIKEEASRRVKALKQAMGELG